MFRKLLAQAGAQPTKGSGFLVGPLCLAVKAMAEEHAGDDEVKEEQPVFDDDAGWPVK